MTPDEIHLYRNDRAGSRAAIDLNGSLAYRFWPEREKDIVLSASGYRLKKGLPFCGETSFFRPREPEIWVS